MDQEYKPPTATDAVKFMVMNSDDIDHDVLLQHLASSHQHMFVAAMKRLIPDFTTSMLLTEAAKEMPGSFMLFLEQHVKIKRGSEAAVKFLLAKNVVEAIRQLRTMYGTGLLETKHLCEGLLEVFSGNRAPNTTPSSTEYSGFKSAVICQAYWDMIKVWKSIA